MGREGGGGFRMGNTCFKIIKLKKIINKIKKKKKSALETRDTREFAVCHVGTQQDESQEERLPQEWNSQHLDVAIASV